MINLHVRRVRGTPYKLVMSEWNVVGIFENKDHKEVFIDKNHFTAAHKKAAELVHARTFTERLEKTCV